MVGVSVAEKSAINRTNSYEASVQFIEDLTSKCDEIQGKVLEEILSRNVETEYLKRYGLSNGCIIDRESFKCKVPIITYDDIKSDIQRIYNGDFSPILCAQPISEFWLSSGTSGGQRKLIPATNDDMKRRHKLLTSVMPIIKHRIDGPEPDKGKAFTLLLTRDEIVTPGGLLARPSLSSVFKNSNFYNDKPYPSNTNTSPIEAIHCSDHFQSIYTQLLCGFYQRLDVTRVKAIFGSSLVWAVHFLKSHYTELCHDISSGTLNSIIVDPSLRSRMVETFLHTPEPELAKFIESACMGENWEGIFKRIWPNAKYLETVVTGSMAQYIPILNYYSGGLPLISVQYSSSECDLGFNLNPMCNPNDISYTLMPNMAYYEFIPLESSNGDTYGAQPTPVDMANVEAGKEYEIVVTTFSGLYRYRVGDVLCATGFYNSTPQFKVTRRKDVVLSIDTDKTTESELQEAIKRVSNILEHFNTIVFEYTSSVDIKTVPGHYVIYVELMSNDNQANSLGLDIMEQCCSAMEDTFGLPYRAGRVDESIGPLEIRVVSNGTFETLRDYAISKGACLNQFKVPRCIKVLPMLDLLDSRTVSNHFSPSVPRSSPF